MLAQNTTDTSQVRFGISGRRLHLAQAKLFGGSRRGHTRRPHAREDNCWSAKSPSRCFRESERRTPRSQGALAFFCLIRLLRMRALPVGRKRDSARATGFSRCSPLRHRQLRLGARHVHTSPAGLQEPAVIFAIVFQKVLEILLLATGHDHKAEPVLVEPAQGSLES